MMRESLIAVISVCIVAPNGVAAQSAFDSIRTPNGPCRVWAPVPGLSNASDWGYSLCALDRRPTLLAGPLLFPTPRYATFGGGDVQVFVRADGTVDTALTRYWSTLAPKWGQDVEFNGRLLTSIGKWRFSPAVRGSRNVKSAFPVRVRMSLGPDSAAAVVRWRYVLGATEDSVIGTWERLPPPPRYSTTTVDSVRVAVLESLIAQGVFRGPSYYCVREAHSHTATDSLRSEFRPAQRLGSRLQSLANTDPVKSPIVNDLRTDCMDRPGSRRLLFGTVHRMEDDRAVTFVRGDYLPAWPPASAQPRAWAGWEARCVAVRSLDEWSAQCYTLPDFTADRPDLPIHWHWR
jgi:hypothetical protein